MRLGAQLGDAARQRERDGKDGSMLQQTNEKLQRELQEELVAGAQIRTQLGRAEAMVATLQEDTGRLEDQLKSSEATTDRQVGKKIMFLEIMFCKVFIYTTLPVLLLIILI